MSAQVWALHVPSGPVAECRDWATAETVARALSREDGGTYRVVSLTSPARTEFGNGQRLPGPAPITCATTDEDGEAAS